MGKRRDRGDNGGSRALSPTQTLENVTAHLTRELELQIPDIPKVSNRVQRGIVHRVETCLHLLRKSKHRQYVPTVELWLIAKTRDAILTANTLNISEARRHYHDFRELMEELGYERDSNSLGYIKKEEDA